MTCQWPLKANGLVPICVYWFRPGWIRSPNILRVTYPPMSHSPSGTVPGYPFELGAVCCSCFSLQPLPWSHYYTIPTNFSVKKISITGPDPKLANHSILTHHASQNCTSILLRGLLQSLILPLLQSRLYLSSLRWNRWNQWSFPSS